MSCSVLQPNQQGLLIWLEHAVHAEASQVELAYAWTGQYFLTLLCLAIVAGCKEILTMSSSCTIASVRKGCSSHSALCACNHIQANTELCSLIDTLQKLNILDQPALIGVLLDCISFRKGNCDETLHCKVKPGTLVQEAMLKLRQRSASRVCCLHDLSNSLCAYLCFVGPQFCWFTPESQGGQLACDCELFLTVAPFCFTCKKIWYGIMSVYDQVFSQGLRDFSLLYTWHRH